MPKNARVDDRRQDDQDLDEIKGQVGRVNEGGGVEVGTDWKCQVWRLDLSDRPQPELFQVTDRPHPARRRKIGRRNV